eukprot:COSAG02_NODE_489_length_21246_cov_49.035702_9_plen_188_part_00
MRRTVLLLNRVYPIDQSFYMLMDSTCTLTRGTGVLIIGYQTWSCRLAGATITPNLLRRARLLARYYELLRCRIHCPSAGRCDCCITCQRERLRRYDSKRTCCAMHINSMAAAATAAAARTGPRAAIGRLAAAKPIGDVDSGRRITRWSADTDAAERPREPRVCDRAASSSRAASSGSRAMPSVVHRL